MQRTGRVKRYTIFLQSPCGYACGDLGARFPSCGPPDFMSGDHLVTLLAEPKTTILTQPCFLLASCESLMHSFLCRCAERYRAPASTSS
jgi:hypothetical protein